MSNIEDGNYNALPDVAAVYEKNDKLVLECRFALCDANGNVYEGVPRQSKKYWLTSADGAINTKTIAQIRKWATGWDGADPFWFCAQENPDGTVTPGNFEACGMVEVVLKTEPYQASDGTTKTWQQIEWVNPIGGGGAKPIASGDRASIMAKYAAKFRAAAAMSGQVARSATISTAAARTGTAPSATITTAAGRTTRSATISTAASSAPAGAVARPPQAPQKAGIPAGLKGQDIVWDKFVASLPENIKDAERDEKWFALVDKVGKDKDQADFTSADWANVVALIENPNLVDPEELPF